MRLAALAALMALVVLGVILSCSKENSQVQSQEVEIFWFKSLEEAEAVAQRTGDPILASFGAYWCPWSRLVRDSLYTDRAVRDSLTSYKCVAIDADRDSSLCKTYDIKLYPTVLVLDPYGNELNRVTGYYSPEDFLRRLSSPGRNDQVLAEMFRREEQAGDDAEFLMNFGDLLRDMGTYDGALMRYERAAQIDKGNRLGISEEATFATAECCMLAGEYKEAGRRFELFAESGFSSDRRGEALILGALCYEQAGDVKNAVALLEDYLRSNRRGAYSDLATKRLETLKKTSRAAR